MTVPGPGHPASDDPLASERLAMVGQLVVAQFDLETAIAELMRSGGDVATAQTQLQNVTQLRQQVGTASPTTLVALRSKIVAAVTQSQSAVQEARTASSGRSVADVWTVASLANRAREQASSFMRDVRQYDDLLQFDNDVGRDAYRQREEERRKRYEAEAAKGTPEGTLNANGAALGQMADLAAHGGSADPALMRRMDELAASTTALREKIIQEGGDVSKFDKGLRTDLRAIMKSKGILDEKIDALLAEHSGDPIDALKAFVAQHHDALAEHDVDALKNKIRDGVFDADPHPQAAEKSQTSAVPLDTMASAFAKLKASGVTMETGTKEVQPGHEVAAQTLPGVRQGISLS